jgi:putative membrane protein
MKNTLLSFGLLLALGTSALAQGRMDTNMMGRMSKTTFDQKNKEGASMVAAITPTSTKLSKTDETLMMQVAKGGMMQLETSRIAAQQASSPAVREYAQAEVEEQTGLSDKLKAIAAAKGVTLPTSPDAELQAMLTKMQGMSGSELDRHYMEEHAIKGHEKIDNTMQMVKTQATDGNLKAVAKAAHPLVKTHLKVAREMQNKMMKTSNMGSR